MINDLRHEKRKDSVLSVVAFVISILGCGYLSTIGLILAIIDLLKKDKSKEHGWSIAAIGIFVGWMFLFGIKSDVTEKETDTIVQNTKIQPQTEKENTTEKDTKETAEENKKTDTEKEEKNTETPQDEKMVDKMTEEEYKEQCEKLWHDDIFFSEENLEGHHVRLEIYTEESKYFEAKAIYDQDIVERVNKYNLQRDSFLCGVSRGKPNSYVGGQIYVYFSDDYGYKALDYDTGQELIIYGEIMDYSTNTWDGYNHCAIIPRYIEKK